MIFHSILISKLGWYFAQGGTTRWVKSWLGCQALWEVVNGSYSALTSGSHQDVSRDLLYNVFTSKQEEEEVKHTLIKFSNLVKSERVANTLEGKAAREQEPDI